MLGLAETSEIEPDQSSKTPLPQFTTEMKNGKVKSVKLHVTHKFMRESSSRLGWFE